MRILHQTIAYPAVLHFSTSARGTVKQIAPVMRLIGNNKMYSLATEALHSPWWGVGFAALLSFSSALIDSSLIFHSLHFGPCWLDSWLILSSPPESECWRHKISPVFLGCILASALVQALHAVKLTPLLCDIPFQSSTHHLSVWHPS